MTEPRHCSICGAELPASAPMGMCVPCLLGVGLNGANGGGGGGTSPVTPARFGDYELLDEGGEGGMGKVYRARQTALNRIVALKVIRAGALASPRDLQRFHAEAEAAASLDHPQIVPIHQVGECDGRHFFTMRWMEGGSLADALRRDNASVASGSPRFFTPRKAAELLATVARAVHHAHQRGIIHRDLKPSNILLDHEGQLHVSDFGLAKRLTPSPDGEANLLTQSGDALGTPAYMAPEQARGKAKDVTTAADVWALGAILYELLCGRPPFVADTPLETMRKVVDDPLKRPSAVVSRLDSDLETICLKCLEKEPAHRFSTALALAEDLERWLRHEPIEARPPSSLRRVQKFVRRNRLALAATAVVLFALTASAWFFLREAATRQRELAAQQVSEMRQADLASRNGRWRDALAHWDAAERAGYRDAIDLGLKRAEAFIVLSEKPSAIAELAKLLRRSDLGSQYGAVLLRKGEMELFAPGTFDRGVQSVRQALTNGLDAADKALASGLIADSTPAALEHFKSALAHNPYFHAAHRHSLGLQFVLGRHEELAEHLRTTKFLYPGDFSPGQIEVVELALQGRTNEAYAALAAFRNQLPPDNYSAVERAIGLMSKAARFFAPEVYLSDTGTNSVTLKEIFAQAMQSLQARHSGLTSAVPAGPLPQLPVLEQGIRTGFDGLKTLAVAKLLGGVGTDGAIEKVRESWRNHPESTVAFFAGTFLDQQQPRTGPRDLRLLQLQSEMYEKAANSPSILPSLPRLARVLAADVQAELALTNVPDASIYRSKCVANLRRAALDAQLTPIMCGAYARWSGKLGELDLQHYFLDRWEQLTPDDPSLRRNRIRLEMASGAYSRALELIDRMLVANPNDKFAKAEREKALQRIRKLNDSAQGANP